MPRYTDDPIADFEAYDREQEAMLAQLPRCSECDEPITGDWCYEINGEYICHDCLRDNHMKAVEDIL